MPSPYSNSLKPTIIVTGILVTDIRFDLFQLKANRGDRIATRPKVLAREIAIMAPKLAGDGNRTFALKKPNDRCHAMLGRDLDAHMHMIWHHMSLDDAAFLLAGQLMKDWARVDDESPQTTSSGDVWAQIQHGTCNASANATGFDRVLTYSPPCFVRAHQTTKEDCTPGTLKASKVALVEPVAYLKDLVSI